MLNNRIDAVIVAGWRVLENNFSESSFEEWRREALDCVVALCGESHPYAEYFKSGVKKVRKSSVLTGVGLLTAARSEQSKVQPLKRVTENSKSGYGAVQGSSSYDQGGSLSEVVNC